MFRKLKKYDGACYTGVILELLSVDEDVRYARRKKIVRSESIGRGCGDIKKDHFLARPVIWDQFRQGRWRLLQRWLHFIPHSTPGYHTTRLRIMEKDTFSYQGVNYCRIRSPLSFVLTFRHVYLPCDQEIGSAEVRYEPTEF